MWLIKGIFVLLWEIVYEEYAKRFKPEGYLWGWVKDHPELFPNVSDGEDE